LTFSVSRIIEKKMWIELCPGSRNESVVTTSRLSGTSKFLAGP